MSLIINIGLLLLSVPVGFLIAHLTKDELKAGRNWFRAIIIVSILSFIWFWMNGKGYLVWTFLFIFIVSLISFLRSENPNWGLKVRYK